jgi:hypothetical protein
MPAKPHRILLDRVSGYADEAAAYIARLYFPGGRAVAHPAEAEEGKALFKAAAHVIEIAGPPRRVARQARAGTPPERMTR